MRQLGNVLGLGSIEKIAESAVKTFDRGVSGMRPVEDDARLGVIVIEGTSPDCTLFMRRDQSTAERGEGAWGRTVGTREGDEVGICT